MGAPPTNQFRIEQLEQGMVDLRAAMAAQVAEAITTASRSMQSSLIDHLTLTMDQTVQRLESRIAKSREEQEQFQAEIRSTISSLKTSGSTPGGG